MEGYKEAIEAAIEREKDILGKKTAIKLAKKSEGIEVDEEGIVVEIKVDGKKALENVVYSFADAIGSLSVTMIARELNKRDFNDLDMPDVLREKM